MPTYQRETRLGVTADTAYAYLSDVANLPRYFPRITSARTTDDDLVLTTAVIEPPGQDQRTVEGEAWFRADADRRSIAWGAPGPHDYHGELDLTAAEHGSTATMTLHTTSDHPGIEASIDQTLASIADQLPG
jgi:uncharacterized membrane protein